MIYFAMVVVIIFGIFYAVRPDFFLRRKYGTTPPEFAIRVARFTGVIMVLMGGAWLFTLLGQGG